MIDNKLIDDFKRPKSAQYKTLNEDKFFGEFLVSPYERGFALTIANSLRRTLLSALEGYAIIAVSFQGINNELQNVPGVYEDTIDICAALKQVALSLTDPDLQNKIFDYHVKGQTVFKAKDLQQDPDLKIANSDLVLFHTNKDADFSFQIQISRGRGYKESGLFESHVEKDGVIILDANYSPVDKVAFEISKFSIGSRSNFEKLKLSIKTNGTIEPTEALKQAAQILKECYFTFNDIQEELFTTAIESNATAAVSKEDQIFKKSVHSLSLSIKSHYFLKVNNIREIGQLVTKNKDYMISKKKFEEDIYKDIIANLEAKGLVLSMKGVNYVEPEV